MNDTIGMIMAFLHRFPASAASQAVTAAESAAASASSAKAHGYEIAYDSDTETIYVNEPIAEYTLNPGYIGSDGAINTADTFNRQRYTSKIPINNGDYITYIERHSASRELWAAYALYDSSETFISRTQITSATSDVCHESITITNSDAKYIAFTFRSYGDAALAIHKYD